MSQLFSVEHRDFLAEVWSRISVHTSGEVVEVMDRRQHTRFDLRAPVTYSWNERESIRGTGHGTTRDVSECGLFVLTDSFPPLGTIIEFEVSFSFRDDSQIQMRTKGEVVRVEARSDAATVQGFAAVTRVLWLQNPALSPSAPL